MSAQDFPAVLRPLLGDEFDAFTAALCEKPALALRLNPLREGAYAVAQEFCEEKVPWAAGGYYLRAGTRPGAGIAHAAGAFYLQEASAMLSAQALAVSPGEHVLDLCAAPGGKSTQLGAALKGRGVLVANEKEASRARVLCANIERMGISNAIITNMPAQRLCEKWPRYFDAVLVDAPCSGEGMFRRNPQARAEWSPSAPAGCAKRQLEILNGAANAVSPGGRMVYSTCTFNAVENENVVRAFLRDNPDFSPAQFSIDGVGDARDGMLRLWPHRARGDGHFVAKFERIGKKKEPMAFSGRPNEYKEDLSALEEITACNLDGLLSAGFLRRVGHSLFLTPAGAPDLSGVCVVSPGLPLLRFQKNRVEPQHALAMALPACARGKATPLSEEEAMRFLAGEGFYARGDAGWTLAVFRGLPLGWGKIADGFLKNHLPKGLRLTRPHA